MFVNREVHILGKKVKVTNRITNILLLIAAISATCLGLIPNATQKMYLIFGSVSYLFFPISLVIFAVLLFLKLYFFKKNN